MRRLIALIAATVIAATGVTGCTSLSEAEKLWCSANDQAVYRAAQNMKVEGLERPAGDAQDWERHSYVLDLERRYPQFYKRACQDAYRRR